MLRRSIGYLDDHLKPVDIPGLTSGVSGVATGYYHTCAALASGGANCWGGNDYGQLGDGAAWRTTPVTVVGLTVGTPTATATATSVATLATPATSTPTATTSPTATVTATLTPSADGDSYEPDDDCTAARPLSTDSSVQTHTFHRAADTDWVRFEASAGTTYRIEVQAPPTSRADVDLAIYRSCTGLPEPPDNPSFSPNVRLDFQATQIGPIFLQLANHDVAVAGAQVTYAVTVRSLEQTAPARALIIVAGRLKASDRLQSNIHNVTQAVYQLFQANSYDNNQIKYLATDSALKGVTAPATKNNLAAAITDWAAQQLGANGVLTLYLVDHGKPGLFFVDEVNGQRITPGELNDWLTQVESKVSNLKVNVIIEACESGSFIRNASSISKAGRLIVTSTNAEYDAKASQNGAYFSDHFLTGLAQGFDVYASFKEASRIANQVFSLQEAWVDGDGNGQPNEPADIAVAASRGFNYPGTLDDPWPPHIFSVQPPITIASYSGEVRANVRDDLKVRQVWGVVYPPSYQPPPTSQELQPEVLSTFLFSDLGDNQFAGKYDGFREVGRYRIVVQAEDNAGLKARPVVIEVDAGSRVFLPMVGQ